jgi:growth hormone secretagogue receptor
VFGVELLHMSPVSCKVVIFIIHWSLMAAAWLIVAVTLERFLVVWLPLRAAEVCKVSRTRLVMAAMLLLLALVNSHLFWTAELVPVPAGRSLGNSGVQCASYAYKTLTCKVFPWVHLVLYCFLPVSLLMILNSLILYRLYTHRMVLRSHQDSKTSHSSSANMRCSVNAAGAAQEQQQPLTPNKTYNKLLQQQSSFPQRRRASSLPANQHWRLAPMLLGVSFCWLLLTTPQTMYNLAAPRPTDLSQVAFQYLIKTICFLLMYTNHALNFFLYCLTGQRFRQELRRGMVCTESERSHPRGKHPLLKYSPGNGEHNRTSTPEEIHVSP